jgi:NAD(P)-dependent dehydrogenase (short-subunit alcohol dehydrogenase family)
MKLSGKIAIVTGGSRGIGEAICLVFAAESGKVVVADQDLAGAERVVERIEETGGTGLAVEVDVTRSASVRTMVNTVARHFDRIDILVNNAGRRFIKGFLEHSEEDWNQMLAVNLTGPFLCSQATLPYMLKGGKGKVINLASIASFMGRPDRVAYCAAKSGLLGLTRAMAVDMAGKNIFVNAIAPGMIASPFNAEFSESPEFGPAWAKENLIGRWGEPADVAAAAVFLASDDSDFITGTEIKVDGGWLAAKTRAGEMGT